MDKSDILQTGLCSLYFPGSVPHLAAGFFCVVIIGYLLGSLNFGVIISKAFYRDDIRRHGSANAGMANMLRTYGKLPAALTFLGDGLKAALAVLIGALILGYGSAYAGGYIGGVASVIGHAFPCWHGFRGGKSVAAGFAMILCTSPLVGCVCLALYGVIAATTRLSSLGSVAASLVYPVILYMTTGAGLHVLIAAGCTLFVVYLHRSNIKRLLNGTESRLQY